MVYAVALALHKNRNPKAGAGSMMATVTTVKSNDSGQIERDNHPDRTWSREFHKDSEGEYDEKLKTAIYQFLGTVAEVAKLHKESGTDYALPVIVGLEQSELEPRTLKEYLAEKFNYIFVRLRNQLDPEVSIIDFFNEYSNQAKMNINVLLRFFLDQNELNNATTACELDEQVEQSLRENLRLAKEGNEKALEELTRLVKDIAYTIGNSKIIKFNSRFVFPGVKSKGGKLILNSILTGLNLKEVFTEVLKQAAGIKHNICVKLEGDERRRPFEDVAMTYVQDMLDSIPVEDW